MVLSTNAPGNMHRALNEFISGLVNNPPAGLTQLVAGGKAFTVEEVVSELQGYAAGYKAVDDAELAHDKAIQARDAVAPAVNVRFDEIRAALKGVLGKKNPDLTMFGMVPNQTPAPLTAEQKVARAAKAKATRAARHTMGPKQKQAIKGEVPEDAEPAVTVA